MLKRVFRIWRNKWGKKSSNKNWCLKSQERKASKKSDHLNWMIDSKLYWKRQAYCATASIGVFSLILHNIISVNCLAIYPCERRDGCNKPSTWTFVEWYPLLCHSIALISAKHATASAHSSVTLNWAIRLSTSSICWVKKSMVCRSWRIRNASLSWVSERTTIRG